MHRATGEAKAWQQEGPGFLRIADFSSFVHLRVAALCFGKSKEFSILSRPDLIDFDKLKKSNAHYNLQNAFNLAEQHLGLTKLLDPEGKNSCSFSTSQVFLGSFLSPLLVEGHSFVIAFVVKRSWMLLTHLVIQLEREGENARCLLQRTEQR